MSIWSSELWCLSHPRIKRTLWKNKSEFVTLVNLNKFVYLRLIWIKPTLSLLGMKILATKAKSASKQLCWWTRWHDPPRASHINGLGFEYLVKLPVKDDFLVLIPEIEPILVYMFILAFDVSHGKRGYLFPEEGGEWVRSESLSVTQPNASGSLLFNKYLLIPYPISQRSLSTKKKACLCQLLSVCVWGSALYFRTFARKEPYHKAGNWLCLYKALFPGYSIQSNKSPCMCSFFLLASHLALFIAFTAHSRPVSLDPSMREECYFQLSDQL